MSNKLNSKLGSGTNTNTGKLGVMKVTLQGVGSIIVKYHEDWFKPSSICLTSGGQLIGER